MASKTQTSSVRLDMTIGEIVTQFPEAIEPLSSAGIAASGCNAPFDESLESCLKAKNFSAEKTADFVSKLNQSIAEIQKDFGTENGETKIVALSSRAAAKVKELMQKEGLTGGLRFAAMPGGCSGFSYGLGFEEKPSANDTVVTEKGISIFIDSAMKSMLEGSRIDYIDSLQGSGFKINNPNAKSTCSCGQSFS